MADGTTAGLLGGLAQGVQQGLMGYMEQKRYQDEQSKQQQLLDQQKQLLQMNMMNKGYRAGSDGSLSRDDYGEALHQAELGQAKGLIAQQGLDAEDMKAESSRSQMARQSARAALAAAKVANPEQIIPDGMSAHDVKNHPLVSKLMSGELSAQAQANKLAGMVGTRQDSNLMRASSNYDSIIGKQYEQRLDAANRVKDLIRKARSGELIPSENLGQQLATDINMLQSGHSTVSGTEHSRPKTLFGKGGQLAHFLSGDPKAAITDADLAQMEKETGILFDDIGNQHKAKFASWIKGQPKDLQPALMDRFNESRNQYFPNQGSGQQQGLVNQPKGLVQPMSREDKIKALLGK